MTKLDIFLMVMPAIVAVMYLGVGSAYLYKGNYGYALVWLCYAGANVGLILSARGI